jgi:hypothetical protein
METPLRTTLHGKLATNVQLVELITSMDDISSAMYRVHNS